MDDYQSGSNSSHANVTTITRRKIIHGRRLHVHHDQKSCYFKITSDIPLLKTCIQLNPWDNNNWNKVVENMIDLGWSVTLRQVKERVGKLVKKFRNGTLHEINTTGTEVQMNERATLIEECISLIEGANSEIVALYTDEIPISNTGLQLEAKVANLECNTATRLMAVSPSTVSDDSIPPAHNSLRSKRIKNKEDDYDLMKLKLESDIEFRRMQMELEEKRLQFQQQLEERRLKLEERRLEFDMQCMEQRTAENIANRNFQTALIELLKNKNT